MLDISGPQFAGCSGVVKKRWHSGRDFLKDILWWIDREIRKVFLGEINDQASELTELFDTIYRLD